MKRYVNAAAAIFLALSMSVGAALPVYAEETKAETKEAPEETKEEVIEETIEEYYEETQGYTWIGNYYINTDLGLSFEIPEDFTVETLTYYGDTEDSCIEIEATQEDTSASFSFVTIDLGDEDAEIEEILENYKTGLEEGAEMDFGEGSFAQVNLGNDEYTVLSCEMPETEKLRKTSVEIYGRLTKDNLAYIFSTYWFEDDSEGIDAIMSSMKPAEIGFLYDNMYANTALGITMAFPESCTVALNEDYSLESPYMFAMFDETEGSSLQIAAIDLDALGEEATEEECLALVKEGMHSDENITFGEEATGKTMIGDDEYTILTTMVEAQGQPGEIGLFCNIKNGIAYVFVATYFEGYSENLQSVIDSITSTEDGYWVDNRYVNVELGLVIDVPEGFEVSDYEDPSAEERILFQLVYPETNDNMLLSSYDMEALEAQGYTEETILDNVIRGAAAVEGATILETTPTEWYYFDGMGYAPWSYNSLVAEIAGNTYNMEFWGHTVDDTFYLITWTYGEENNAHMQELFNNVYNLVLEEAAPEDGIPEESATEESIPEESVTKESIPSEDYDTAA